MNEAARTLQMQIPTITTGAHAAAPMNEVFVLTSAPVGSPGGQERFLGYLIDGLGKKGFATRVFEPSQCSPPFWRRVSAVNRPFWAFASAMHGYYVGRAASQALHPGVRLVISNGTIGWFPPRSAVPALHFYHGTYRGMAETIRDAVPLRSYLKTKWWESMMLERLAGRDKARLSNSYQTQAEVERFFRYTSDTVWLPLDVSHFSPLDRDDCRHQLGFSESETIGLFVGNAGPAKGLPVIRGLIQAFAHIHWVLALRGRIPSDLQGIPNVAVYPNVEYRLMPLLYNCANFVVCPSRYESFGYVVAESLACGTPVVASLGGASLLLLESPPLDKLLVANVNMAEAFEVAISQLLSQEEYYREAVNHIARPVLRDIMEANQWHKRFIEASGL